MFKRILAATALLATCSAYASISVGSVAFNYSQSFDSLATTGSANAWANDSTLAGWSLFTSTGATPAVYTAENGASNAGAFRSFGVTGSSERALGATASGGAYFGSPANGAVAGYLAVSFTNNTGSALNGFTLGFDGEQWRNGGNATAQSMVMQYGFGASFASVGTWTAPGGSFDWTSPVATATAAAVVGNTAGLVAGLGGAVTTTWASNDTLWVRWIDRNDAGNDHGLAIDNVTLSVSAVPEPGSYALMLAGLAAIGFVARRRKA